MIKFIYIFLGSASLTLAIIGIVVPGLPTTPFLLLAATLYFRSSKRLYAWLLDSKYFGKTIREFREKRAIGFKVKIYAISLMWIMVLCSIFFFLDNNIVRVVVLLAGIIGTLVMGMIPVIKDE